MRVSIVNLNLVGRDAIGQAILNQVRFFQRRGDLVQVFLEQSPRHVPLAVRRCTHVVGLADLVDARNAEFAASDLFVYHFPGRFALLDSIRTLERGVVIFYYHNVTPPELWGSSIDADVLRDSVQSVGRYASWADLIVTDSEFNAEGLVRDYGLDRDCIRVLPLGVSLSQYHCGPKKKALLQRHQLYGRRVLLFVGRMAGNKRIDLLVEALPLVRRVVPEAVLLLVGDNRGHPSFEENVRRAREKAVSLGVDDALVFTGLVEKLPEYYRLADVYATASLHEGFGVPLIEAMASGVPVVASRIEAHAEVLGEAGLLCEPCDASDLAEKLLLVLTDDALRGELVRRGLLRAQDFSLESHDAGWARVVREAAAWLPNRPYPRMPLVQLDSQQGRALGQAEETDDEALVASAEKSADVMLRGYVVRSGLPLIGSLVAWIRRNLTSHLREPYLDPTLERQVGFNQCVTQVLKRLHNHISSQETLLHTWGAQMQSQLDLLAAQISRLELQSSGSVDPHLLAELEQRIEELREQLKSSSLRSQEP